MTDEFNFCPKRGTYVTLYYQTPIPRIWSDYNYCGMLSERDEYQETQLHTHGLWHTEQIWLPSSKVCAQGPQYVCPHPTKHVKGVFPSRQIGHSSPWAAFDRLTVLSVDSILENGTICEMSGCLVILHIVTRSSYICFTFICRSRILFCNVFLNSAAKISRFESM